MTTAARVKQTLSVLKSSAATLRIYGAKSRHEEARPVFNEACGSLEEIVRDLENRVSRMEFEEPQF